MKKILLFALVISVLFSAKASAADVQVWVPLDEVVKMGLDGGQLDGSVTFHLKGNSPRVSKKLGSDRSNRKTNAFNKTDEYACQWVVLSTLVAFQASAKQKGANAVIDIVSFYKANVKEDPNNIECYAGTFVAGAAIRGTYAVK